MGVVLMNAADPCRREQYSLGPMLTEPAIDCSLVAQVNGLTGHRQQLAFLLRKPAHQRRTHHPAVARDKYLASFQGKDRRRHESILSPGGRTPSRTGKAGLYHGLLA